MSDTSNLRVHPGDLIARWRDRAGLNNETLAERADVSVAAIKRWANHSRLPRPSTLRRVANALHLSEEEDTQLFAVTAAWKGRCVSARHCVPADTPDALEPTIELDHAANPDVGDNGALMVPPSVTSAAEPDSEQSLLIPADQVASFNDPKLPANPVTPRDQGGGARHTRIGVVVTRGLVAVIAVFGLLLSLLQVGPFSHGGMVGNPLSRISLAPPLSAATKGPVQMAVVSYPTQMPYATATAYPSATPYPTATDYPTQVCGCRK